MKVISFKSESIEKRLVHLLSLNYPCEAASALVANRKLEITHVIPINVEASSVLHAVIPKGIVKTLKRLADKHKVVGIAHSHTPLNIKVSLGSAKYELKLLRTFASKVDINSLRNLCKIWSRAISLIVSLSDRNNPVYYSGYIATMLSGGNIRLRRTPVKSIILGKTFECDDVTLTL
ncbi:hypothetical protein DRO02_02215 [archaeon]|nr:MAG: hypothetical protein DRO21_02785 [archaeon]RLG65370.1 MAG: hypothetical protein DRO02_02215 [archaeon]HDM23661.1 hypothetical protein [Candidatus Bathyarchaeota archaeon]